MFWLDAGASAWSMTDSNDFYIDLTLRSAEDPRFDGQRPRLRVRLSVVAFNCETLCQRCTCDDTRMHCKQPCFEITTDGPIFC